MHEMSSESAVALTLTYLHSLLIVLAGVLACINSKQPHFIHHLIMSVVTHYITVIFLQIYSYFLADKRFVILQHRSNNYLTSSGLHTLCAVQVE